MTAFPFASRSRFGRASVRVGAVVAVALAACSSSPKLPPTETSSGNTHGGVGGSGGGDDGGSSSSACGFAATPSTFVLPTISGAPDPAFAALSNTDNCTPGTNKLTYSLLDLNGDSALDLVVTTACDDSTIGTTAWLVYLNTGTGFATTATRFALPPSSATNAACAKITVLDINGDLRPDWVVTSLCDDVTVGTTRWLVYPNSGTGFAQTSTPYELPPGSPSGSFLSDSNATLKCTNGAGPPVFDFFDITGDLISDFVVSQACDDLTVGTTHWRVYAGSASGASQTAATFALPSSPAYTTGAFTTFGGALDCASGASRPAFSLVDFDDDGKIDIVATQVCLDATVGSTRWLLYKNTGSAFATAPATLTLPTIVGAPANAFAAFSATADCGAGSAQPGYTFVDGNDDGRLDLLVLRDCSDALTGYTYWQIFLNDGTGFASSSVHFALPSVLGATAAAPAGLSASLDCAAPAHPGYVTTYLTNPFAVVETSACGDSSVGFSRWLVYSASCE